MKPDWIVKSAKCTKDGAGLHICGDNLSSGEQFSWTVDVLHNLERYDFAGCEWENEEARARWDRMAWNACVETGHIYLHVGKWFSQYPHDECRTVNLMSKHRGGSIGAWYALPDGEFVPMGPDYRSPWPIRDAWVKEAYQRYCEQDAAPAAKSGGSGQLELCMD